MHNRSSERAARTRQESPPSAEASRRPSDRPPKSSSRVISRSTPPPPEPFPSAPEAPARRKKILLVDDSMTALMMNRMLLSKCGCDIVTARDGSEAIEKALAERPDVIVMDIVMPKMNGFEACKRLRTMMPIRHTPILLVTTRGEAESIATGFASGCTDYVTKPVNSVELLSKIKAYLGE